MKSMNIPTTMITFSPPLDDEEKGRVRREKRKKAGVGPFFYNPVFFFTFFFSRINNICEVV